MTTTQFVRPFSCEASHEGSKPGVNTICGIKKIPSITCEFYYLPFQIWRMRPEGIDLMS
jgi:hypothetical protein